ncbi:uncharacterized protein LOC128726426 [Anopheles nili]|uniref:uncharacterized protein LOC128726426 n=1 Tax=Anopheles nili TaxID=185578 RepID=UPI00237B27E4|nr:uncharacterized protein LOC128726426 [Anopheles nili]
MEVQELTTCQQPEEIIQPFTISCVGETIVVCAKDHTLVLQLRFKHVVEDGIISFATTRIKCSTARPTSALLVNETDLYNASNMEQRKQIMLDQTIFPNIAKVHIYNVQSWVSPSGIFESNPNEYLIANLTNMGQLTIYRQDGQWISNWNTYVDISDTWQNYIYNKHSIESFEELQTMVDEMIITCFAWECDIYQHPVRFAFGTKSGKIVLCTLMSSGPQIEHVHQEEETSRVIKYLSIDEKNHFLLVGLDCGRVALYRFGAENIAQNAQYVATFYDPDLAISTIECEIDRNNQSLLILVVKATYLLVLEVQFDGTELGSGTVDLENFMITGLQHLEPRKYIATMATGTIFHIFIHQPSGTRIQINEQEVKSDLNVGSYALYGVAATRTRACWAFLGYPSKRFDHLSIRSPTCLFFAQFNECDPLDILQRNKSFKMTDYYDAAEVIRYRGNKNADTLKPLEDAEFKLNLNDFSMYQLKLQLVQIGAKISLQSKRSKIVTEILHNQLQFICSLIEGISACMAIFSLSAALSKHGRLDHLQQRALQNLRNFIRTLALGSFSGDYECLHAQLQPKMMETLDNVDHIETPDIECEICSFCDAPIDKNKLECSEKHPVFRCVLTKIQVPINGDEVTCQMCQRYSLKPDVLALIFDHDTSLIDFRKCCICDVSFITIKSV